MNKCIFNVFLCSFMLSNVAFANSDDIIGQVMTTDLVVTDANNNITLPGSSIGNSLIIGKGSIISSSYLGKGSGTLAYQNDGNGKLNLDGVNFKNNGVDPTGTINGVLGGVMFIYNTSGDITISNSIFENNMIKSSGESIGGAIAINNTNATTINNTKFIGNYIDNDLSSGANSYNSMGGAIYNSSVLNITGSSFENNCNKTLGIIAKGGAIANITGTLTITDTNFSNNSVSNSANTALGGAIYNTGSLSILALNQDVVFSGNTANGVGNDIYNDNTTLSLNANSGKNIIFNGGIAGTGTNTIEINKSTTRSVDNMGTVVFNSKISNNTVNLHGGTVSLGENGSFDANASFNVLDNARLSTQNTEIQNTIINSIVSGKTLDLSLDVDLGAATKDEFTISNASGATVNVDSIKVVDKAETGVIDLNMSHLGGATATYDLDGIQASGAISNYDMIFDPLTNKITLNIDKSGGVGSFSSYMYNQTASMNQLASMQHYISYTILNKDNFMLNEESESGNKYGMWLDVIGLSDETGYDDFSEVDNDYLSFLVGFDTKTKEFDNGTKLYGNVYLGYLTGSQKYDGNDVDNNGGYIGASGFAKMGNWITSLTGTLGFLDNEADTLFGKNDYNNYYFGLGAKVGYGFDIAGSGYIIEPALYLSYMFVSADDYTTNTTNVRISEDNLNSLQIIPSVKVSKIFGKGYLVGVNLRYVEELVGDLDLRADSFLLPELTDDGFIEYGVSFAKEIKDTFVLGFEVNRRDIGKTGWTGNVSGKYYF